MPSLFSRSRTTSAVTTSDVDDFGRRRHPHAEPSSPAHYHQHHHQHHHQQLPDGFFPTNLAHKPTSTEYGYLSYKRSIVLSLENVSALTEVVCEELGSRGGITTPFVFSSLALDINPSAIKRLIDRFLESVGGGGAEEMHRWREEARFAGPHELGMVLRWGLARVLRFVKGQGQVHGLVSWEHYTAWRTAEQQLNYPPNHFTAFLPALSPPLRSIILTTLSLLTRLTAHSTQSGHTPPTLSPLFGPLFFGLHTQNFVTTYQSYLRSTHATEHLLLSFIRWQDSPRDAVASLPGVQTALAVPTRLKEWIKDYPSQISPNLDVPRKGARQLRILTVKRNVRMYSTDLVKSASSWAYRKPLPPPSSSNHKQQQQQHGGIEPNGLIGTPEWERISPGGKAPRFGDGYRKRMNMPSSLQPDSSYQALPTIYGASAPGSLSVSGGGLGGAGSAVGSLGGGGAGGTKVDVDIGVTTSFRSLTDLKWGEFESLGFSSPSLLTPTLSSSSSILSQASSLSGHSASGSSPGSDWLGGGGLGAGGLGEGADSLEKKLQFDLTETARSYSRHSKRQTLSWNDFSSTGFSRNDHPLSTSLSFSPHLTLSPSSSPSTHSSSSKDKDKEREKEERKLMKKKTEKMPLFGWDTTPVLGGEEVVEEGFFEVWCDFLWGSWGVGASTASHGGASASLSASAGSGRPTSLGGQIGGGGGERDLSRDLERECNWALIEYKSLPPNRKTPPPPSSSSSSSPHPSSQTPDPRTNTTILLFEEFVPLEYRQELAKVYGLLPPLSSSSSSSHTSSPSPYSYGSGPSRTRLVSLFTSPSLSGIGGGGDKWKQAQTLNGKPYVVGQTPLMSSRVDLVDKESEFEGLLRGSTKKVIKLSSGLTTTTTEDGPRVSDPLYLDRSASLPPPPPPSTTQAQPLSQSQSSSTTTPKSVKIDPTLAKVRSKDSGDSTSSPSTKKRFGLSSVMTPSKKKDKNASRPPAGYSSVEFETRFRGVSSDSASDSGDSELSAGVGGGGGGGMSVSTGDTALDREREEKKARRMSRRNGDDDDAWVDILVGSQSRGRIVGQEVEVGPGSGRRRPVVGKSDPDLASKAVAQALANVPLRRSTSSDSLSMREKRRGTVIEDSDVDEIQTIPRTRTTPGRKDQYQPPDSTLTDDIMEPVDVDFNEYSDPEDDYSIAEGEEESAASAALREARNRRKAANAYFDLHPDRKRPISTATVGSQYSDDGYGYGDDGERLAYDESEDGGHVQYAQGLPRGAAPPNAPSASPPSSPPAIRPLPVVPLPGSAGPKQPMPSNIPVPTNPVPSVRTMGANANVSANANGNGHAPPPAVPEPTTKSKTASLIEMYREKERGGSPSPGAKPAVPSGLPPLNAPIPPLVPTPAASRLPVRNASLPVPPAAAAAGSPPQVQAAKPVTPPRGDEVLTPPKPVLAGEDTGRASPSMIRYVHGAPLHNVLEEEEED